MMPAMSTRRKHLGCAVYNNMIYAVGGRDDCTELSSAERYNPHTNQWSPIVAMTSRRSGVSIEFECSCWENSFSLYLQGVDGFDIIIVWLYGVYLTGKVYLNVVKSKFIRSYDACFYKLSNIDLFSFSFMQKKSASYIHRKVIFILMIIEIFSHFLKNRIYLVSKWCECIYF